jgi:hypothetical protein
MITNKLCVVAIRNILMSSANWSKWQKMRSLLFFCPKTLAIVSVSGIITTNLGKTATLTKITGRKKTDTSLQNMPFSQTGEGYFFGLNIFKTLR